jgi:hypothetical protein
MEPALITTRIAAPLEVRNEAFHELCVGLFEVFFISSSHAEVSLPNCSDAETNDRAQWKDLLGLVEIIWFLVTEIFVPETELLN